MKGEAMRVRTYDVDQDTGAETFDGECELTEAFPDKDDEYYAARAELERVGRYWCGGGASPLRLLMLVGHTDSCASRTRDEWSGSPSEHDPDNAWEFACGGIIPA